MTFILHVYYAIKRRLRHIKLVYMHARAMYFLSSLYFILLCCSKFVVNLVCFGRFLTWFKFSALKHFFVNNKLWFVWGFIPYLCAHLDGEEEREEEGIISVLLLMVCPCGIIKCYQISRLSLKVIVYFWVNHNFSDLPIVVKLNHYLNENV